MNYRNDFTTIYIVRHGESEGNAKRMMQGQTNDMPLTEKGRTQAAELAKELKNIKFDAVFSSDLIRAKHTADIVALERELAINTTKALRERNLGAFEGASWEKFDQAIRDTLQKYQSLNDERKWEFKLDESMESDAEVAGRFLTFLREVAVGYPGKTILVVSHGGMIRALLAHLGHFPISEIRNHFIGNAATIKLRSDGIDFFLDEVKGVIKREENM